jgi:RimJ/RimL family protein N-acetyltransferase
LKQTARGFPERIETERLTLGRWTEDEWPRVLAVWSDPAVWRALWGERRFDEGLVRSRFEHHVAHWDRHGFGLLVATEKATGDAAGWIGAAHPDFVDGLERDVEIGWSLREPFRGRGLATEGAAASIDAAFDRLGLDRVIALIDPANSSSIAVARRLGMRHHHDAHHMSTGQPLRVYALDR